MDSVTPTETRLHALLGPVWRSRRSCRSLRRRLVETAAEITGAQDAALGVIDGSGSILLTARENGVAAVIEDDGKGFDPKRASEGSDGLTGMREQVALLDGKITIESREGAGTTLVAEVPVR